MNLLWHLLHVFSNISLICGVLFCSHFIEMLEVDFSTMNCDSLIKLKILFICSLLCNITANFKMKILLYSDKTVNILHQSICYYDITEPEAAELDDRTVLPPSGYLVFISFPLFLDSLHERLLRSRIMHEFSAWMSIITPNAYATEFTLKLEVLLPIS